MADGPDFDAGKELDEHRSMKLQSSDGLKRSDIVRVAMRIICVGALVFAPGIAQAQIVRVDVSGTVNQISGSNLGRLAGVVPGTIMNFSYSYPSDLPLKWSTSEPTSLNSWFYQALPSTAFSTLQVGPIYREFPNFQLTLYEGVGTNLTGPDAVDFAVLFALIRWNRSIRFTQSCFMRRGRSWVARCCLRSTLT